MKNKHIGSTLQSLFDELGEGEEFRLVAQKKAFVIAAEQRMTALKMSKNALAKRMGTSRPAVDRLLDPNNTSLTFASLNRATQALGLDFALAFFESKPRKPPRAAKRKPSRRQAKKGRSAAVTLASSRATHGSAEKSSRTRRLIHPLPLRLLPPAISSSSRSTPRPTSQLQERDGRGS